VTVMIPSEKMMMRKLHQLVYLPKMNPMNPPNQTVTARPLMTVFAQTNSAISGLKKESVRIGNMTSTWLNSALLPVRKNVMRKEKKETGIQLMERMDLNPIMKILEKDRPAIIV
jgi:hypothetical protein